MKKFALLVACVLLITVAVADENPKKKTVQSSAHVTFMPHLWGNSRSGMNEAQVLALYPDAKVPDVPNGIPDQKLKELRVLSPIELVNEKFSASFLFNGEGSLVWVQLRPIRELDPTSAINLGIKLVTPLRNKYGNELSVTEEVSPKTNDSFMHFTRTNHTWVKDATKIVLNSHTYSSASGELAHVDITYSADAKMDSDKL
jgi:hypothetical protein